MSSQHGNSPCCPSLPAQHPQAPQLTEDEENAHGEQDHSEHQPPDPQALVIWEGDTQGSFLLASGRGGLFAARGTPTPTPHAQPGPLTIVKGILLLLLRHSHWKGADKGVHELSEPLAGSCSSPQTLGLWVLVAAAPRPTAAPLDPCQGCSRGVWGQHGHLPSATAAGTSREHRKMSAASMAAVREGRRGCQHPDTPGRHWDKAREHGGATDNLCGQAGLTHTMGSARLVLGNTQGAWCHGCTQPSSSKAGREGFQQPDRLFLWGSVMYF